MLSICCLLLFMIKLEVACQLLANCFCVLKNPQHERTGQSACSHFTSYLFSVLKIIQQRLILHTLNSIAYETNCDGKFNRHILLLTPCP